MTSHPFESDSQHEVDGRKSPEAMLKASREAFQAFVESAPIGMLRVDSNGIIKWANKAELALFGYVAQEYIGHSINEFHTDKRAIEDILDRLARGEQLDNHIARILANDGSIKTVRISSSVLWQDAKIPHAYCFTRDVTNEAQSQIVDQRLIAIIESSDDAIVSKDLNGIITSWNSGAESVFGYTAEEAIGQPILILIPPGRHNEEPEILRRIRSGEKVDHYQTQRQRKDGSVIDISVTISPIRDTSGQVIGASKIARDVTIQKRLQEQLEAIALELSRAKEELEERVDERTASLREAVAQMEEISYTISHDLRAPLRAMKMYSQALLEEWAPNLTDQPEAVHYLERISENSEALDRMIQDVLTFGRVAREGVSLEPVSLDELVANLIGHYPALQGGSVDLAVDHLGEVMGHPPSLSQVFSNLLLNAAKFVAPGVRPSIRVYSEPRGEYVRVWVEDNGIGIDPKFHHRLFGLFERLHPNRGYEGNGVGLAIVRKAALRMSGAVGVESDGQSGSRFWFELPGVQK